LELLEEGTIDLGNEKKDHIIREPFKKKTGGPRPSPTRQKDPS
jgi:hypothetical protein